MSPAAPDATAAGVRVGYKPLVAFVAAVFSDRGVPADRAVSAARALCYGDLAGMSSHGVVNLTRLYLPLFEAGRVDPRARPCVVTDRGAAVLVDACCALGLWHASDAMDMAVERAAAHGIGMVSVRRATHCGCAGHHATRAVAHGMIGLVASNCGGQRIARPPGGRLAMLGTNPLSVAAPAGDRHPFVLDMSTTVVPTGRIRQAARAGAPLPEGWLADDEERAVTDAQAFDRGDAHLLWLGATPAGGAYKGFGLGIVVELLAALVSGSAAGPAPQALDGDGRPSGVDDDIGMTAIAIAPGVLRAPGDVERDAASIFGTLLACPPTDDDAPVRYPGWHEAERARVARRDGVLLPEPIYAELRGVARDIGATMPEVLR